MISTRRVIGLVLAIPVMVLLVAVAVQGRFDGDWETALITEFGRLTAEELSLLSLSTLCADAAARADLGICGEYEAIPLVISGAIISAVVGCALVLVIREAGERSYGDRERLVRWFRPVLFLAIGTAVTLVLLDGILVVAAIYLAMVAFLGAYWPAILLTTAGAVVIAAGGMITALLRLRRRAAMAVTGRRVTEADEPRLWGLIDGLAERLGIVPPDHVVVGLEPTFFVTEADVTTLDETLLGQTVYVSLPLCQLLTIAEVEAVLGHELGHFVGEDTAWSRRFAPMYRGLVDALVALRSSTSGVSAIASIPAHSALTYLFQSFALNESAISRDRELAADQVGASVTSPETFSSALTKIVALAGAWPATIGRVGEALTAGESVDDLVEVFVEASLARTGSTTLSHLDRQALSHPTDTHPRLSDRLAALGQPAAPSQPVEVGLPEPSAAGLFVGGRRLAIDLSAAAVGELAPTALALAEQRRARQSFEAFVERFERERAGSRAASAPGDHELPR